MTSSPKQILSELKRMGDPRIATQSLRFFKTGKGEYGEGDQFLGIRVPTTRALAKEYQEIKPEDVLTLLHSPFHEARQLALIILVRKYAAAKSVSEQEAIYKMYMKNIRYINGWDLVDCSAEHIPGAYLFERDRKPLFRLLKSDLLWERRVAIMSTFHFIKKHDFGDTLALAKLLLQDQEDLMHKATGWMLREVGNRDRKAEETFLLKHYKVMPRTMLRYAIEKFPEPLRKAYLQGKK